MARQDARDNPRRQGIQQQPAAADKRESRRKREDIVQGLGDFRAVVQGVGHKIEPLSLVKVYGAAAQSDTDQLPQIDADFVRDWHWGAFTFLMASGEQRGSKNWRKLNRVDLDDIYEPYPDDDYYEQRLGKPPKSSVTPKIGRKP